MIHGKPVEYSGEECGIYRKVPPGLYMDYAVMDPEHLADRLNDLPRDLAITALTELRNMAAKQAAWSTTPGIVGAPIMRMTPAPQITPIDEVRGKIENSRRFADEILKALQGQ